MALTKQEQKNASKFIDASILISQRFQALHYARELNGGMCKVEKAIEDAKKVLAFLNRGT